MMNPTRKQAIEELQRIVLAALSEHNAAVWLFGSCARGEVRQHSDIDIAIRAARRLGWLSDEDAAAAIRLSRDRNLAVHMYRGQIGEEIAQRLGAHAALLRLWLAVLKDRSATPD